MTTRYRDLAHFNQFVVQLWMFASPVIYPMSAAGEKWRWLLAANPASAPLELLRYSILGRGSIESGPMIYSAGVAIALFASGTIAFQNAARSATDHA